MNPQSYRGIPNVEIVYRPRYRYPAGWFAWVAKDSDAHLPPWRRRLEWWPVTEKQALEWYRKPCCGGQR